MTAASWSVLLVPVDPAMLEVGDIVRREVAGNDYLHIVKAIRDGRYRLHMKPSSVG